MSKWSKMSAEQKAKYNADRRARRAMKKANNDVKPVEKKGSTQKKCKCGHCKDCAPKMMPDERLLKAIYGKDKIPPTRIRTGIEREMLAIQDKVREMVGAEFDGVKRSIQRIIEECASIISRIYPSVGGLHVDFERVPARKAAKKSAKNTKKA